MALRCVLFGTSAFAVPILERLAERTDLRLVVTTPVARGDRGRRVPTPVGQAAAARSLALRAPARSEMDALAAEMGALGVQVMVVAAYGRILPPSVIAQVPVAVNVHPSLLPRHRGAAPVARTLLDGDPETGVTLLGIGAEVDAAPIYDQVSVAVLADEDRGALEGRLSQLACTRLATLLTTIEAAGARPPASCAQVGVATYAHKLSRADEGIAWSDPAPALVRRVRALGPRPGARARTPEGPLLVLWAEAGERPPSIADGAPGTVGRGGDGFPWVATGDGRAIRLTRVRPAGKTTMDGDAYLRGRPGLAASRLGDGP